MALGKASNSSMLRCTYTRVLIAAHVLEAEQRVLCDLVQLGELVASYIVCVLAECHVGPRVPREVHVFGELQTSEADKLLHE